MSKSTLITKLYYGSGATAFGIKDTGFNYFILIYYNQVLGLDPFLAGFALALAIAIDAMTDVAAGYWSDQLRSGLGRRHPFMYAAIVPTALSFYFLWNPMDAVLASQSTLFVYLLLMAVLVRSCLTFFEVPNASLGPELTSDYDDRTRLMGYRYVFGWLGGLSMAVLAYGVWFGKDPANQLGPIGYEIYGVVGASTMAVAMLISSLGTHRHIPSLYKPDPAVRHSLKAVIVEMQGLFGNASFRSVFFSALFFGAAAGLSQAFAIYVGSFFWLLTTQELSLIPMLGLLAVPMAFFLSPRLSAYWGKKKAARNAFLFAILFLPLAFIAAFMGIFPSRESGLYVPLLMANYAIETTAIITMQVIFASMNADVVEDRGAANQGRRSEGLIFAARNFAKKAVSGLGVMVAGALLWIVNFPENAIPGSVDDQTVTNLVALYLPVLLGLYLLSWYVLRFYTITRDKHEANVRATQRGAQPSRV